jgi:hypothetical protein
MTNSLLSECGPFLTQFEDEIPRETEERYLPKDAADILTIRGVDFGGYLGTTKLTRVPQETTDDE